MTFIPGLTLNGSFYRSVIAPIIGERPHAAARLGTGSEVLGFDSARSTDHGWGPRLELFVDADAVLEVQVAIDAGLPDTFEGWPVRYGWDAIPEQRFVSVATLPVWLTGQLGVDASAPLSAVDWLLMPQQSLLEVTAGAVYHDGTGELSAVREALAWYPQDVWLWMLAAQWRRVAQEEAFVGRAAEVGDELGSRLVAGRLARELMRLWFLLSSAYWPYTKWFGSAFARLPGAERLGDALAVAVAATTYAEREAALGAGYRLVAERHNASGLTISVDPATRPFYGRPFEVLMAERFVAASLGAVSDPALRALPLVGSVDQVADSTDLLSTASRCRLLRSLYVAG